MDKLNNYIPVPMPIPQIPKQPCLTPACLEQNKRYEEAIKKQLQSPPISNSTKQQNQ
jgi:hypothetical protein